MFDEVAVRIQNLAFVDQMLVLGLLASRRADGTRFSTRDVVDLFDEFALPRPTNPSATLTAVEASGYVSRNGRNGRVWAVTPNGKSKIDQTFTEFDIASVAASAIHRGTPEFGGQYYPLLGPAWAPPGLLSPIGNFLSSHPFDKNVFGMTRFPNKDNDQPPDSLAGTLEMARRICKAHGLEFHLASDRSMVDDLWGNVTAHMWAASYGLAILEDRADRGLNYNLTIEIGSMLMTGRRCVLLKDRTAPSLPTDLVGHIYKSVDIDDEDATGMDIHRWIADDLDLGKCPDCR